MIQEKEINLIIYLNKLVFELNFDEKLLNGHLNKVIKQLKGKIQEISDTLFPEKETKVEYINTIYDKLYIFETAKDFLLELKLFFVVNLYKELNEITEQFLIFFLQKKSKIVNFLRISLLKIKGKKKMYILGSIIKIDKFFNILNLILNDIFKLRMDLTDILEEKDNIKIEVVINETENIEIQKLMLRLENSIDNIKIKNVIANNLEIVKKKINKNDIIIKFLNIDDINEINKTDDLDLNNKNIFLLKCKLDEIRFEKQKQKIYNQLEKIDERIIIEEIKEIDLLPSFNFIQNFKNKYIKRFKDKKKN